MSQGQKGISLLFYHAGYYEIACSIMGQLTASDVGALLASLRITPSQHTVETFLQPLRDFDHTMRLFEPWFQDNCQIMIIGPDTIRLSDRIFNADEYYKGKRPSQTQLEVWIFAIPANFEKSAKEVQCLRHCSHASSLFSIQERAEGRIAGQELLENNMIRQISYTDAEPSKVPGEYLDVKVFDLFSTTTHRYLHTTHLIGLEFAGMEFGIEWNIKDRTSKDHCWKASHGIPYIEAASPRDTKVAVKDRWRHQKSQSLVFYSVYPDWDPQSTVSIPISSS
ncbi:unnamed protein product [Penicillium salamii]|uniref:Uncharacterized protein n=1 Tax=Penicillium salamii TaxID=1612424 RepID=A0A9W4NHD6_9EURO|nr:unnamed protein product [Penicillium salamii]CAG8318025.1 unnamed protein product [Penicillium salamii]CAG8367165.1 unnamed protein product [Penicillium salamii]CAG8634327.1 unnamed protein product [Penicillium salamii]CAG8891562.1 unnamed protein product [Penicillium salamii]